jgi:alpha-beta hydrolase superfamily lysophospholipase
MFEVAEHFCKLGYEVLMVDLRGFGYSGGPRGAAVLEQLLKDVGVLLQQANPNLPLFLYGHSMGGLLVLTFTLLNPKLNIAGTIATSPLIGLPTDRNLTWFKLKILFTVSKDLEVRVVTHLIGSCDEQHGQPNSFNQE